MNKIWEQIKNDSNITYSRNAIIFIFAVLKITVEKHIIPEYSGEQFCTNKENKSMDKNGNLYFSV